MIEQWQWKDFDGEMMAGDPVLVGDVWKKWKNCVLFYLAGHQVLAK
jgi:hypothetical protein